MKGTEAGIETQMNDIHRRTLEVGRDFRYLDQKNGIFDRDGSPRRPRLTRAPIERARVYLPLALKTEGRGRGWRWGCLRAMRKTNFDPGLQFGPRPGTSAIAVLYGQPFLRISSLSAGGVETVHPQSQGSLKTALLGRGGAPKTGCGGEQNRAWLVMMACEPDTGRGAARFAKGQLRGR